VNRRSSFKRLQIKIKKNGQLLRRAKVAKRPHQIKRLDILTSSFPSDAVFDSIGLLLVWTKSG